MLATDSRPPIKEKIEDTDVGSLEETKAKYEAKGWHIVTPDDALWWTVPPAIRKIASNEKRPAIVAFGHTLPLIAVANDQDLPAIARTCEELGWKLDVYYLG